MPIIRNALTLCAIAFIVSAAVAETDYSGYVKLNGEDTESSNSWNVKGKWSNKETPSPDNNYYVPAGSLLWRKHNDDKNTRIWKGGQLAIAGTFHCVGNKGNEYAPYIADLVLCPGALVRVPTFGPFSRNDTKELGQVTIKGTVEAPSVISHQNPNSDGSARSNGLNAKFKGDSQSMLVYERPEKSYAGSVLHKGWTCQVGTEAFADYPGTLAVRGATTVLGPSKNLVFNWPDTALRIEQGAKCLLWNPQSASTASESTVRLRSLAVAGGQLEYGYADGDGCYPAVNVSESFSVDGDSSVLIPGTVKENISRIVAADAVDREITVARCSDTDSPDAINVSSARVAAIDTPTIPCPVVLAVSEKGNGARNVVLSLPSDISVMTNNASQTSSSGAFDQGHEKDWTKGKVPDSNSELHYWLNATTYISKNINLPKAVVSVASSVHCVSGVEFLFKELNFCGVSVGFWGNDDKSRSFNAERINIYGNTDLYASNSRELTFNGELCGNGTVTFRNDKNGNATMHFNGKSTNYTGRVVVTQRGLPETPDLLEKCKMTFYLDYGSTFNGRYTGEDSYRSITFSKFPTLNIQRNVTFAEPTRGILVERGACFTVAYSTLTISNQVTYAGLLEKRGSGTLDLAGSARFIDGNADTLPKATTNVIDVQVGELRISSKAAADGLEIRFEEGTKLLIPADTEAGYYNVKWDNPLVVDTVSRKLPVVVEGLDATEVANVRVPVCTINSTAAENISADMFDVSTNVKGVRIKSVEKVANEDGSVSYVATFGRFGCRILFR